MITSLANGESIPVSPGPVTCILVASVGRAVIHLEQSIIALLSFSRDAISLMEI